MRWTLWLAACGRDEPAPGPSAPQPGAPQTTVSPTSSARDVPPPYGAPFLWAEIAFEDALDLGFVPQPVPEAEQVEPSPLLLAEVALEVGLEGSIAGGNSHGVGIGWFDADGDGWEDIFVASGLDDE